MAEDRNLSIALVSSYEFTREPGGVKDFILGLKKALQKNGCKVFVIAPGSRDAAKEGVVDYVLGMGFKLATDQTEFMASFSRKKTARKILSEIKPDIIVIHEPLVPSIGHTIISSVVKSKNGGPIIIGQFHASREDMNWPLKVAEFFARHLMRRPKFNRRTILGLTSGYMTTINNNLDGRIAVSKATKKFWQKKLPADYEVIYNGIDTKELSPEGSKINSWIKNDEKIILFAGRHDPRKGMEDLINGIEILVSGGHDDLRLKIAGAGELTVYLKKIVERMNLHKYIEFVGVLPRAELVKAYRTVDLVVAPSADGEGFNRTIIEARSCGTLVVCTKIGGQDEAIGKDLAPFMAKSKNPRSLAEQIMKVLSLPEIKKQEIRKNGIKNVKNRFDWDNIAREHIAYYKSLISKN